MPITIRTATTLYRLGLYLSAYIFTVMTALLAVHYGLNLPLLVYFPLVSLGYGLCFLGASGLRVLFLDLLANLQYRERIALFLVHAVFFVMPIYLFEAISLIPCFLFLNIPLCLLLQRAQNFNRLYANNILILITTALVNPQVPVFWLLAAGMMLITCMIGDRFVFIGERYSVGNQIKIRDVGESVLLYVILIALASLGLYGLTPRLPVPRGITKGVLEGPAGRSAQPLDTRMIFDLVLSTVILLMLVVGALALLSWLHKKLRKSHPKEFLPVQSSLSTLKKIVREKIIRRFKTHFSNPREMVVFYYGLLCEQMRNFGFGREPWVTPLEYASYLKITIPEKPSGIDQITDVFQRAKYSPHPVLPDEAKAFKHTVELMISTMKETVTKQKQKSAE
jgi:hypothetical protein